MRLTPEEHDALAQMVQTRGWAVVLRELMTKLLVTANGHLDAYQTPPEQTQYYRGVKYCLTHLLTEIYRHADHPDPFVAAREAFLVTLREPWSVDGAPTERTAPAVTHPFLQPRRAAPPVL
jgi:hypothetical protein